MSSKTVVLITGANTGIGYETVRALLHSSTAYHILLGARSAKKSEDAAERLRDEEPNSASTIDGVVVDIESDESIGKCLKDVEALVDHVDVLINNAGIEMDVTGPKLGMTTREIFAKTWDTNFSGTHIFTTTFIPLLLASKHPRLLFLTSGTASFELTKNPAFILNKAPIAGWPKPVQRELTSYKASKVGVNMLMRDWERILRNDGVKVWTVNPGFLVTGLGGDPEITRKMGAGEPRLGGEVVRDVVEGKRDQDVGQTVQANGILAW